MQKVFNTFPADDGFHMPAEFEPHEGTILIWPVRPGSWPYGGRDAQETFVKIAMNLALSEKVYMVAKPEDFEEMNQRLSQVIEKKMERVHDNYGMQGRTAFHYIVQNLYAFAIDSDDSWARDIGPTFVRNEEGELRGIDWQFNAWGGIYNGLYAEWQADNAFAREVANTLSANVYDQRDFVLEGGSIHVDGEGTCVVTEACLLSKGRNPDITKEQIEERLKKTLGVEKVIWLPHGIFNDETDEHVDNVFAFTAPGEAVLAWTEDESDPQYEMSRCNLEVLENEVDAKGRKIKVHKLPIPKVPVTITERELAGLEAAPGEDQREVGERLAASYVNFYIANDVVLVPQFGDENDKVAIEILTELFPTRKVKGIQARSIIVGGGNIHCITQQVPMRILVDEEPEEEEEFDEDDDWNVKG